MKSSSKRTYIKRKRSFKKRRSVKKDIAVIKKQLRARTPETKHIDSTVSGVGVDNNPTFNIRPYANIGQGVGDFGERIGDKIKVRFFNLRMQFYKTASVDATPRRIRVGAFIYKRNPDQAIFAFSTIINLYLSSTSMNSFNAPLAFRDWDNHASFHTLHDKLYTLNHNADVDKMLPVDFTIKFPAAYQTVQFSNNGTGTVVQNELFVFAIQTGDTGLTADYQWRITYTDS